MIDRKDDMEEEMRLIEASEDRSGNLTGEEAEEEALRVEQVRLEEEKKTKAGEMLVYNACSEGSSMAGKILLRGEGVSFEVIDFLETVILRPPEECKREPPLSEGQKVQVMYHGQAPYRGTIVHFAGHNMYRQVEPFYIGVASTTLCPVATLCRYIPSTQLYSQPLITLLITYYYLLSPPPSCYSVRYDVDNDVETSVHASRLTATNLTFRLKVHTHHTAHHTPITLMKH